MIQSFGNKLANDLFEDLNTKIIKKITNELKRSARRKILYLHDASDLKDLRIPPGNRLEALKEILLDFTASESTSSGESYFVGKTETLLTSKFWTITHKEEK